MTDASHAETLVAAPPRARGIRDDARWLLRFARVWYGTHRLKVRREREHLSDRQYYRMAFALDHDAPGAVGDKFASTRAAVTRGIRKDQQARQRGEVQKERRDRRARKNRRDRTER